MSYKILIVDDEPENLQILVNELLSHNEGLNILQALNSSSALYIAEKHIPDLIITDWQMPGGNGIDLIKNLKENKLTKDIPVIMSTGVMTNSEHLKMALRAGATDYIKKPIDSVELIARTESILLLSKYHKESLEAKNKELTSSALSIAQNNEFHSKLISKLQEVELLIKEEPNDATKKLKSITSELNRKIKEDSWNKFNLYFQKVHFNFEQNLLRHSPSLSPADIRLAALLRLGMTTKDIASITYNTPESTRVARTRLRKKLNLSNEENLTSFLTRF